MAKINYKRPKLFDYQIRMLDSKARYTVCEASTKTGKTASHIIWLLEQAIQGKYNQNFWWVAPVFGQAKIAFRRMKAQVNDKSFFIPNETDLTLTLPNGSVIWFKSAEKPDNLYGEDVYAAVFDEFTRAREESWFALRSTLSATGGKCKFIGNVKGKANWGYKLAQKAKHGADNHEYFKITAYDAANAGMKTKDGRSFLEEIEQAKEDLPDYVFKELYLAEAAENTANPFGSEAIAKNIMPLSDAYPVCFGIDLAKSHDYTVITGLDNLGAVCVFDRFQGDWTTTLQKIRSLPKLPMTIDSTGVGDPIVEQLQNEGFDVEGFKFTSTSKQELMLGLQSAIHRGLISYPEGVITDELSIFEYTYTPTGVKYSAPAGFHDDAVCSLALAWHKFSRKRGTGDYSVI